MTGMNSGNDKNIKRLAANIQKNSEDLFSKFALALELLKRNQVNRAKLLFESVYKQDPEYLGVYYHLGKLYQSIDLLDDALFMFKKGVDVATKKNDLRTKSELLEAINQLHYDRKEADS